MSRDYDEARDTLLRMHKGRPTLDTGTPDKPRTFIDERLEELIECAAHLNDQLDELEERLKAVLRPPPEEQDARTQGSSVACPLDAALLAINANLRDRSHHLSTLLDRLAL